MHILIIEDKPEHLQAAKLACEEAGFQYFTATNLEQALGLLDYAARMKLDGIISDIFFPERHSGTEIPAGIAVALRAETLGLPFVFCTSGYHHGVQYNWICELGRSRRWPEMVDGLGGDTASKDWLKAIKVLQECIAPNGAG